MKIERFIWLVAAVTLTACSRDDSNVAKQVSYDEQHAAYAAASDVPIHFAPVGMGDFFMEAEITRGGSVDSRKLIVDSLGLFCLAQAKIDADAKNINWYGYVGTTAKLMRWMDNVMAHISSNGDGTGMIGFEDELQLNCFPTVASYTYGFAAYHPRTTLLKTKNSTNTAYIVVDGNDDVFFAVAAEPEYLFDNADADDLAFSKNYYDKIRELYPDNSTIEGIYPKLIFKRMTSRLDFYFKMYRADNVNFRVDKVEFDEFPNIIYFGFRLSNGKVVSSVAAHPFVLNNQSSELVTKHGLDAWGITKAFGHFELRENGEEPISGVKNNDGTYKYKLTDEYQKVGDCIMIPPVYNGHSKANINLYVTLVDDAGNKYKNTAPFCVNCPSEGWQMGRRYAVNISLTPPVTAAAPALTRGHHEADTAFAANIRVIQK